MRSNSEINVVKKGQNLDPRKTRMKKKHQGDVFSIAKYVTLDAHMHQHNCKEYEEKKNN
jgi:hypothetical protein